MEYGHVEEFSCPLCQVVFTIRSAVDAWDDLLSYDLNAWVMRCKDPKALTKVAPGACIHCRDELPWLADRADPSASSGRF